MKINKKSTNTNKWLKEIKKSQAFIWQRFIGWIIDFIIAYIITMPAIFLTRGVPRTFVEQQLMGFYVLIGMIIYSFFMEYFWGKTIGKVVTMTKVIYLPTLKIPGFAVCLGRNISRLIPFDMFSYIFSFKPAGWHDRISNTRVIRDKNYFTIIFHSLFEINKGVFRILIIIFSILSIFLGFSASVDNFWRVEEEIFMGLIFTIMIFFSFWLVSFIIIILVKWVKKGFEENK